MDEPLTDRSELEEMVASSPFGMIFVAPTLSKEACTWSFIIHDNAEAGSGIRALVESKGAARWPEIDLVLVPARADGLRVLIPAFLFRFKTDPPVVYFTFMNPCETYTMELLSDIAEQEFLVVEFFEDKRSAVVTVENNLRDTAAAVIASLARMDAFPEDTYYAVVHELLVREPDPTAMWELLHSISA